MTHEVTLEPNECIIEKNGYCNMRTQENCKKCNECKEI